MSFAARLLEWLLAPLLFLWLFSLGTTFLAARETVDTALDDQLNLVANVLYDEWSRASSNSWSSLDGGSEFPSLTARRILANDARYPIRYLIVDANSRVLAGDEDMSALLKADAVEIQRFDAQNRVLGAGFNTVFDDEFVRALRFSFESAGTKQRLVVSQSRARQDGLLHSIMLYDAIPQSLVLFVAVFLVWYGLAYVRPMRALESHLDSRGGNNLAPLPLHLVPSELEPLITSINSLMGRLQSSLVAQKRFIANAAHQLRTPLAALRAHSELLKRTEDPQHRNYAIDQLLVTSSRANRLTNQLLSMARAESSSTTAQFDRVELNALCRDAAQEILPLALERNIEFAFDAWETPLTVRGDATLLTELTHNLIDNALKYTPRHGTVLLSLHADPVRIVVEDSGPGISEDERERVFAPFARIARFEAGSRHAVGGTGLGLAIVEEVARSHRAKVGIEKSRWDGAKFTVTFAADG